MKKIDITGEKYGKLTVVGAVDNKGGHTRWLCKCECGKEKTVRTNSLRMGTVKSCGCLVRENGSALKHGCARGDRNGGRTRLYRIWRNMRGRCNNKNKPDFERYGGRGIFVCEEWDSFPRFMKWALNNGYAEHLTIDRKDNDDGYYPENCRWATYSQQAKNKRKAKITDRNRTITVDGESATVAEWSRRTGIPDSTIRKRLRCGRSDKESIRRSS